MKVPSASRPPSFPRGAYRNCSNGAINRPGRNHWSAYRNSARKNASVSRRPKLPSFRTNSCRSASSLWRASSPFNGFRIKCETKMKTKTLHQTVKFKASPKQVYEMLMDSRKHRSLSGMRAKISRRVGGKFTAWGTHISGFNLALLSGRKIVQAWRATGWWPDHYSIAIFDIKKARGGSRLEFTQIGVPPNRYSGHYRGWIEAYWTPMKEVFERGKISEKTRRRVRQSRDQRIKTGKFRRKISMKM